MSVSSTGCNLSASISSSWPRMSPVPCAGQVEVGVVGEVHHGRLVGGRGVVDAMQLVGVGQGVDHGDVQRAGVALVAVGAGVGDSSSASGRARALHELGAQTFLSNPSLPPCRWFWPLLAASLYFLPSSVNCPLAMRLANRPVRRPWDRSVQVPVEVVEAEDHVGPLPVSAGRLDSDNGPAEGGDANGEAAVPAQGEQLDVRAFRRPAKGLPADLGGAIDAHRHSKGHRRQEAAKA